MNTPRLSPSCPMIDRQAPSMPTVGMSNAQHLVGFDEGPGLDGEEVAAGGEQFLDDGGREAALGEIAVFVVAAGWHRNRSLMESVH